MVARITQLTTIDIEPPHLVTSLPHFTHLVALNVTSEDGSEGDDNLNFMAQKDFFTVLHRLAHLRHLAFISLEEGPHLIPPPLSAISSSLPLLLSLAFVIPERNLEIWNLVPWFPTLEKLSIDVTTWFGEALPLVCNRLPNLQSLTLKPPSRTFISNFYRRSKNVP